MSDVIDANQKCTESSCRNAQNVMKTFAYPASKKSAASVDLKPVNSWASFVLFALESVSAKNARRELKETYKTTKSKTNNLQQRPLWDRLSMIRWDKVPKISLNSVHCLNLSLNKKLYQDHPSNHAKNVKSSISARNDALTYNAPNVANKNATTVLRKDIK